MGFIGESLRNFVNSGPLRGGQFTDRLVGNDIREWEAVPPHLRSAIVNGTNTECREALETLRQEERLGKRHFGYGVQNLAMDMRSMRQDPRNQLTSRKKR